MTKRPPPPVEHLAHDMAKAVTTPATKSHVRALIARVRRLDTKWFLVVAGVLLGVAAGTSLPRNVRVPIQQFSAAYPEAVLHAPAPKSPAPAPAPKRPAPAPAPKSPAPAPKSPAPAPKSPARAPANFANTLRSRDLLVEAYKNGVIGKSQFMSTVHGLLGSETMAVQNAVLMQTSALLRGGWSGHPAGRQVRAVLDARK